MKIYRTAAFVASMFSCEECIYHSVWKSVKPVANRFREYHVGVVEDYLDNGMPMYKVYRQYGRIGRLSDLQLVTSFADYDRAMEKVRAMENERISHKYVKIEGGHSNAPTPPPEEEITVNYLDSDPVDTPLEPIIPENMPKLDDAARERLMRLMAGEDPQLIFLKEG